MLESVNVTESPRVMVNVGGEKVFPELITGQTVLKPDMLIDKKSNESSVLVFIVFDLVCKY